MRTVSNTRNSIPARIFVARRADTYLSYLGAKIILSRQELARHSVLEKAGKREGKGG